MKSVVDLVKLSVRNLMSIKKYILLMLVCFSLASIFNPMFSVMLMGMITYITGYQTMAYEDTYQIDYLISYLPVTRKDYVISRYIFNMLMIIISGMIFSFMYLISIKLNLQDVRLIDYKTNLCIGIIMSVILSSTYIPVILKLGIKKSRFAMIFIFLVTTMIPSFLVMSIKESELIRNIILKISQMNIELLTILSSIIVIFISYFVSLILYKNKEVINS